MHAVQGTFAKEIFMKRIAVLLCVMLAFIAFPTFTRAADDSAVDCVTTEWKLLGANHKVCVSAFVDPDIPNVACYISQARTGGVSGSLGLAEDPSNFAISCTRIGQAGQAGQAGHLDIPADLPAKATVFKESTSFFFKATRVTRIWDKKRNTLVYLAISRHLVDGSPFNAISTVPVY